MVRHRLCSALISPHVDLCSSLALALRKIKTSGKNNNLLPFSCMLYKIDMAHSSASDDHMC